MKFSTGTKFLVLLLSGVLVGQTKIDLATQAKGVLPAANGGMGAAPTASDQMPVSTAPNVWTFPSIPVCANDGLHSLTYSTSTHTLSCTANSGVLGTQYRLTGFVGAVSGGNAVAAPLNYSTDPTGSDLLGVRNLTSGNVNYEYNADLNGGTVAFAATSTCIAEKCAIYIPSNSSDTYTPSNGNVGFGGNYKYPDAFGKAVRVIDNRFGFLTDYVEDGNITDALPHLISAANFHVPTESWAAGGTTALTVSTYDQAAGQYNYGAESGSFAQRLACDFRDLGINECEAGIAAEYGAGDKVFSYDYWFYAACGYGNGDDEHCHFHGNQARETDGTLPVGVINAVNPNGGTNDLYLDPGTPGTVTKMGNNRTIMLVQKADGSDASVLRGCSVAADNTSFHSMPVLTVTGCTLPVSTFQGHVDSASLPINTPKNFQVPQSMTFTVDTDSGTASVGNFCIGDVHRHEVGQFTNVTAVSGGFQVTALIVNNYLGDDSGNPPVVFQGGLCGTAGREVSGILNNGVNASTPTRTPSNSYTLGQLVVDPYRHVQKVTTAGTSASTPNATFVWNHFATTTDGTVTWTDQGYVVAPMSVSFNIMGSLSSTTLAYDMPSGYVYHVLSKLYQNAVPQAVQCNLTRASNVVTAQCLGQNIANLPLVSVTSTADPSFDGSFSPTVGVGSVGYVWTYTWAQTGANVTTPVTGYAAIGVGLQELAIYPATQVIGMTAPAFTSDTHTTTSGEYVKLQNNSVIFPVGGLVEEEFDGTGAWINFDTIYSYEPQTYGSIMACNETSCTGPTGVASGGDGTGFFFQTYENDAPASLFQGLGGYDVAPDGIDMNGPIQNYLHLALGSAGAWSGPIPGSSVIRAECDGLSNSACAVPSGQWDLLYADTKDYQAVSGGFGGAHIRVDAYDDALQLWVGAGTPAEGAGLPYLQMGPSYIEQGGGTTYLGAGALELGFTHTGVVYGGSPQIEILRAAGGHVTLTGYQLRSHQDTLNGISSYGTLDITADSQLTMHSQFMTANHCLWLTGTYSGVSQLIATGDLTGGDTAGVGCVSTILGATANGFIVTPTEGAGSAADQWTISANVDGTHYLPSTTDHTNWNNTVSLGGSLTTSNVAAGTGAGTSPTVAVSGLDATHQISVTTGTTPTASATLYTLTYTATRGHTSYCVLNQVSGPSGDISISSPTATTYAVSVGSVALAASTTYVMNVVCP